MKVQFILDTAGAVLHNLRATRLRTALAVLGVSFGVAAVMAVLSIGQGGEARVRMELNDIGINRAWMYPDQDASRGFKLEDAQWLSSRLNNAVIAAGSERDGEVSSGSVKATATVIGSEWQLPQMESTEFKYGRFFTKWEEESARPVVVLESRLASKLYGSRNPTGFTVLVGGRQCKVVGVVTKRNILNDNGGCYVPITTYNSWFSEDTVDEISISAQSSSELRAVRVKASMLLESRTGGVKLVTLDSETKVADNVLGTFKTVILCVAVVALIVGGIGIMNMMYMSVNERIREIGIRKALGAKQNQILLQFMLEAAMLALAGGFLGIFCGVLLALAASALADVPFIIPLYAPFIGTGFSAGVGLIFGIFPAMRAARLCPVDALRSEV
jgi:putative ABC transport system permease protein